jgi:uncharacterized protein YjlB
LYSLKQSLVEIIIRGEPGERPSAIENIAKVPLPATDPVGRTQGPVIESWLNQD